MGISGDSAQGRAGLVSGSAGQTGVDLLLLDGFFGSAVSVTLDVLATANVLSVALGGEAPFSWTVRSLDGGPVRSSAGLSLEADGSAGDATGTVHLVFGQAMASAERILGDLASADARALARWLPRAHERGATLAASCSSTFLLAEAGLLDGGEATTCWWLAPLFRDRYPRVALRPDALLCTHDRVLTAAAAMAQLDLALAIVRRAGGQELAHACARYLVIDESRSSQAPYLVPEHLARRDELVGRAEQWISARLDRPIELTDVAAAVGVSERTLARRFVAVTGLSPVRFLRRLRVEAAARLLVSGDRAIADVAQAIGYDDERAFRRAFTRHFGRSPVTYRRAFRDRARPE